MVLNKINKILIFLCIILKSINANDSDNDNNNNTESINLNREGRRFNNIDIFGSSLTRKFDDTDINDNNNNENDDSQQQQLNDQQKKPLKNIFMGIYKNYRSTYLGNRTSLEYKKSLQDNSTLWSDIISEKSPILSSEILEKNIDKNSETSTIKTKRKKKKKKNNNRTNKRNKGSVTKKDEALLYSNDGEHRYNLGPGVNLTLDMNRDIVNVNLDEDCLKDILYQKWDGQSLGRGRGKKHEMLSKILPLFILPFLIQSAIIPFLVTKLKLLLIKSILIGKLAIFLLILSAIRNNQKTPTYEAAPAYWASEPSRRSEIFNGYRVEGRPTTWLETIIPQNDVIGPSLQLALTSCQENFKWDQWNCPTNDFLGRTPGKRLDREEAFITALTTAALIYTITKNCSNNQLPQCRCNEITRKNQFIKCSDKTEFAENIIENFTNSTAQSFDIQGNAYLHNIKIGQSVIKNSIRKYCRCKDILTTHCLEETCWTLLKPFSDTAKELRQMYDRALYVQMDNSGTINLNKISKNVLVFVHESLNYCQMNVIPGWKGMQGRQCSREKDKSVSLQERRSCRNLCRACGLRVKEETVLIEKRCNCKFTWCCDVKCDICVSVKKEFYCA